MTLSRRRFFALALLFTVFGLRIGSHQPLVAEAAFAAETPPIRIGILAKRGPERCLQQWGPTADYLSAALPDQTFAIVPLAFDAFFPAVADGTVDLVLANSSIYISLEAEYGASRLATLKNRFGQNAYTRFGGVIFCRAERSDLQNLGDLRKQNFMAVNSDSFGGFQVALRELQAAGLAPEDDFRSLSMGDTHDAVVYAVASGQVDAGTVRTDTLERMAAEGLIDLDDFKILHPQTVEDFPFRLSTRLYPEWPLAKLPHVPETLAQAVAIALFNLPAESPAAQAARCAGWTIPLNYQPVHECLKDLKLGPYRHLDQITPQAVLRQYGHFVGLGVILVLLGFFVSLYLNRLNHRLRESRSELSLAHHQLEERVAQRTADLRESNQQLTQEIEERRAVQVELQESQKQLQFLAHHDALTGLPNRVLAGQYLKRAMAQAQRNRQQVALLFCDLDRFKNINDSLGHKTGDEVLQRVAQRMSSLVRRSDSVARLGGDEFLIILDQIQDSESVDAITSKLMQGLREPFMIGAQEFAVTASVGISLYPADAESVEEMMRCADTAMYRAKALGNNHFQYYTADMNARSRQRLQMEVDLRKALDAEQFRLYFQPQLHLSSRRLLGMEALIRWQHPERGLLLPGEFIPLAEETDLILAIGAWVLQTACRQAKAWQESSAGPVPVAVNIAARQFWQRGLVSQVQTALEQSGLDPQLLELEITETMIMKNLDAAIATMGELNAMGVRLAIDDFGTGYSSLGVLKRFPLHKLKIDRSFVRDVNGGKKDAAITHAVIALARGMELEVVAEGVETDDQLNFLLDHQCQHAQGFLFSHPMPAEHLTAFFSPRPDLSPSEPCAS